MLTLSRKVGEWIVIRIDGKVVARVQFTGKVGDKIKLGFVAADEVEVNRQEIDDRKYPVAV